LRDDKPKKAVKGVEEEETEEQISMRIMRRGALMAFEKMAARFGAGLFDRVGKFWEGISAPLISAFDGTSMFSYMAWAKADSRSECGRDRRVSIVKRLVWTGCD
jgi:TATA-binding protein-associated factor